MNKFRTTKWKSGLLSSNPTSRPVEHLMGLTSTPLTGSSRHRAEGQATEYVETQMLVVWKTEGEMILESDKEWRKILENINVNDQNNIKRLAEGERVANLGLSAYQILLVQISSLYVTYFYCPCNVF